MEKSTTMESEETEMAEPHPDIHELFCHYNSLYFDNLLGACIVTWSSFLMNSCAGICRYLEGGGCEICLSERILKFRSNADLKNTLLHEMIHAFLYIKLNKKDHRFHGRSFTEAMNAINTSSVADPQRPSGGYNITVHHNFGKEVDSYRLHHWICEACGDLIKRAVNRKPSPNDCIERKGHDNSCDNLFCHWHRHKMQCSGRYIKTAESLGYKDNTSFEKGAPHEDDDKDPEGPAYRTRHATGTLQIAEGINANSGKQRTNKIVKFFPSAVDEAASSGSRYPSIGTSKLNSAPKDKQQTEGAPVFEIPRRQRTFWFIRKRKSSWGEEKDSDKRKRRVKICEDDKKQQSTIDVPIPCSLFFADEESEEEVEPLINKRTERRKKEKLLNEVEASLPNTEPIEGAYNASEAGNCTDYLLCSKGVEMSRLSTALGDRREASEEWSGLDSPSDDSVGE